MSIPNTDISFSYDPRAYTARRRNRPFGGVVEMTCRLDGRATLTVGVENVAKSGVPSDANRQSTPPNIDASTGEATIRETRRLGDYWCDVTARGGKTDARAALTEDLAAVAASLNANQLRAAEQMACPVDLCGARAGDAAADQHAIIDILIGQTPDDLHLETIGVFPRLEGFADMVLYQGRPLLAFTRALADGTVNWNANATPKGGFLIVQLPRIQLGRAPIDDGRVRLKGAFGNGRTFDESAALARLNPEIMVDRPVPTSWRAINGPDELSIHRLAVGVRNARLLVAQRGAVDFNIAEGRPEVGTADWTDPAAYPSFGAEVRAPCDGIVSVVEADQPDMPVGARDDEHPRGNQVCITREDGLVVVLAHLRRQSLRVTVGDRVVAGQPVGEVGNSGRSSEPHLHMHVADSAETVADGAVFRFREEGL